MPRSTNFVQNRTAFTIVEILVVVAVLSILSAVLFTVFGRVREGGRRSACLSNVRQIGQAFQAYIQDNQGYYPPPEYYNTDCIWAHRLLPYTRTHKVFECPSYPEGPLAPECAPADFESDPIAWYNGSYRLNHTRARKRRLSLLSVRQPSDWILVTDGLAGHAMLMTPAMFDLNSVDDLKNTGLLPRHSQGLNALYADGHAKWLKDAQLLNKDQWQAK